MKRKIAGILVVTLLIATAVLPVVGTMNVGNNQGFRKSIQPINPPKPSKLPLLPPFLLELFNGDWNYWSNPPDMYTIPTGNVGIGTMTPGVKLEVAGEIQASQNIFFQEDNDAVIGFNYPDNTFDRRMRITAGRDDEVQNTQGACIDLHGVDHPWGGFLDLVAGSGSEITFWTGSGGAQQRMVIDNDGNVGIGTTGPNHRLEVVETDGLNKAALRLYHNSGTTQTIGILSLVSNRPGNPNDYFIRAYRSNGATEVFNLNQQGKAYFAGGVDPPYVSYTNESHESIRQYAQEVEDHEKVMQFWNGEAHRMEMYVISEDTFYTITGELIE